MGSNGTVAHAPSAVAPTASASSFDAAGTLNALREASQEDGGGDGLPFESGAGDAAAIRDAAPHVLADLAADHAASVRAQNTDVAEDTSTSFVDDTDAFQAAYDAARARQAQGDPAVPYLLEDATGGLGARDGGRGFGVEIEFDLPGTYSQQLDALDAIGRDLHDAGLTQSPRMFGYHEGRGGGGYSDSPDRWRLESDSTVAGEIVSPIMYDEPQTWQNLATVCDVVRRHGGRATARTGGHVHVSAGDYDHTVGNHHRLLSMVSDNEDTLYRLAQNPARPAHRGLTWCRPNSVPAQGYTSLRNVREENSSHYVGVNMQSLNGRNSDHVEFRMWDGSLDPGVIQTQVKVSLGLTDAAFRGRGTPQPGTAEPVGTHRAYNARTGNEGRLTGEAWRDNTHSFRRLADALFRRDQDKAQATALFAVTRWQRAR